MTELFDKFEINRMPRWPLMSRLLALSIVLHGIFLVAVIYVPTLRSVFFMASSVAGLKFVSEDYDRTLIGQRATIIKLGPHEKLVYPPDYFGAPAVAETTQLDQTTFVPQYVPPPPVPTYRPRRTRTPRGAQPVGEPSPSPTPGEVAEATPTPSASPTPDEAQKQADAEMDKVAKEMGIVRPPGNINTKPFEDVAVDGKKLIDEGKLDLKNSTIALTATAERNEDGTLKDGFKIEGAADNESLSLLSQQLITALSQSKVLVMLQGAKVIRIGLKLDQQNVSITVESELESADIAEKSAMGYAFLAGMGRTAKKGTDEAELYNNLKFKNDGKQFMMSFEMPKESAGKLITDMLAKKAAKEAAAAQNKS
ncbi:MAG: hypothetical protein H7Z38_04460 [Rubrivivax sp.]|nr:hypothetical protein [Pyrinomonadaceae bacterium]